MATWNLSFNRQKHCYIKYWPQLVSDVTAGVLHLALKVPSLARMRLSLWFSASDDWFWMSFHTVKVVSRPHYKIWTLFSFILIQSWNAMKRALVSIFFSEKILHVVFIQYIFFLYVNHNKKSFIDRKRLVVGYTNNDGWIVKLASWLRFGFPTVAKSFDLGPNYILYIFYLCQQKLLWAGLINFFMIIFWPVGKGLHTQHSHDAVWSRDCLFSIIPQADREGVHL